MWRLQAREAQVTIFICTFGCLKKDVEEKKKGVRLFVPLMFGLKNFYLSAIAQVDTKNNNVTLE